MNFSLLILTSFFSIFSAMSLLAQSTEVATPPDQSFWQTLVMIGIAFAFFYVILWRPEQKRRKAAEAQRNALKKGDKVVVMGILGTVVRIDEQRVILKMYDGNKIEVYKAAISDIIPDDNETTKKGEEQSE